MSQASSVLSDQEYERFRLLIQERSGLHFPDKRRQDLWRGLKRAFEEMDSPDWTSYYQLLLASSTDGEVWERLICQITIGETYFFRNRPQFEALRQRILPELIQLKRSQGQYLRIWSAGCATGEEPYSIAMLLRELLPDLSAWNVTILATDINREALSQAQKGRYGNWSFREKGWEQFQQRYFSREHKHWELAPVVREMVSFAYLNLVEDTYPSLANNTVAFDLIICRNVTIYFTPEITQRVVEQLYEALVKGGWLIVGHSEPSPLIYRRFEPRNFPGAVLYQKSAKEEGALQLSWLEQALSGRPGEAPTWLELPPLAVLRPPLVPPAAVEAEPIAAQEPVVEPCEQAEAFLQQGQAEQALEILQQVLQQDRGCARAYYLLGKVQADRGYWPEAQQWCEKAVAQNPLLTEGHFLLALVHSQQDNFEAALASMKRVVYLERKAVLGHFWLANIYGELGDEARARKSLQNTRALLQDLPVLAPIPWSDGMTAGRLLHAVRQRLRE
ncbi:MAG: tetratricopeptide repeat protein [Chloroflexia bacterium]|nr:tetratricopeptide repeat protein [Chloroflexia bacterium]